MKEIITVATSTKEYIRKGEGDTIELKDGRIFLAYMEFSGDGSDHARTRIVAKESVDRGKTWGGSRVLTETATGDINVYSPNLIRDKEGHILLIFMRAHACEQGITTMILWRSQDEGRTFQPLTNFAENRKFSLCNAVVKRARSGRLLLPVDDGTPYEANADSHRAALLFSDDDGRSWEESASRISLPMRGAMEPHIEESSDGSFVMVMRNQLGSIFMSSSSDGGISWSLPQTTGLRSPESCPEITSIPRTGDLLMIWNNSLYDAGFASHYGKRSPLTSAISRDHGRTWEFIHDIESNAQRAFSNPGCRFLSNGTAIINYWTCEYTSDGYMQDVIDLRVAIVNDSWFYRM